MPIIDLALLKIHLANLVIKYGDPNDFLHDFHNLVDDYFNHTKRESANNLPTNSRSDNITSTILNQLVRELSPLIISDPSTGTFLIFALWEDESVEARILSSFLLGIMDPIYALDILVHLPDWLVSTSNKSIHESLIFHSFKRIRQEKQTQFLHLIAGWLKSSKISTQILGIRALIPLLLEPSFEDLPTILRIIKPTFLAINPQSQKDIRRCISALEIVSNDETFLFLRELLNENYLPFNKQLRRILPGFSPELQKKVRNFVVN
jgi:hypothetical protein